MGRAYPAVADVTAFDDERRIVYAFRGRIMGMQPTLTYTFEPAAAGIGTRFTRRLDVRPAGVMQPGPAADGALAAERQRAVRAQPQAAPRSGAMTTESTPGTAREAAPEAAARRSRLERAPRRSPTDLSFALDAALVRRWASEEPDWLAADRLAGLAAAAEAAIEPNVLYTIYLDLRAADLADVHAWESAAVEPEAESTEVPEGAAGLAEFREDRFVARALDDAARAGGVRIETFGALVRRDPAAARSLLDAAPALPGDDRVAQFIRAGWNQAVVVDVPDGVRLERPLVVRWGVGAPGRALIARTFVRLGRGASASVVEEIVAVAASGGGPLGRLRWPGAARRVDGGHPRPRVGARLRVAPGGPRPPGRASSTAPRPSARAPR